MIEEANITHEATFKALDKGNFSREMFSPSYANAFAALPPRLRERIIREESSVTYGITPEMTKALYQRLYSLKYPSPSPSGASVHMHALVEVLDVSDSSKSAKVTLRNLASNETGLANYD